MTATLPRPDGDEALLLPGGQAVAGLAAAAIAAQGLLTAWTGTQSVISMVVQLPSTADALAAGVAVARALSAGDGIASVTAGPVATVLRLPALAAAELPLWTVTEPGPGVRSPRPG